jgi:hypothetical protein
MAVPFLRSLFIAWCSICCVTCVSADERYQNEIDRALQIRGSFTLTYDVIDRDVRSEDTRNDMLRWNLKADDALYSQGQIDHRTHDAMEQSDKDQSATRPVKQYRVTFSVSNGKTLFHYKDDENDILFVCDGVRSAEVTGIPFPVADHQVNSVSSIFIEPGYAAGQRYPFPFPGVNFSGLPLVVGGVIKNVSQAEVDVVGSSPGEPLRVTHGKLAYWPSLSIFRMLPANAVEMQSCTIYGKYGIFERWDYIHYIDTVVGRLASSMRLTRHANYFDASNRHTSSPDETFDYTLVNMSKDAPAAKLFTVDGWIHSGDQVTLESPGAESAPFNYNPDQGSLQDQAAKALSDWKIRQYLGKPATGGQITGTSAAGLALLVFLLCGFVAFFVARRRKERV